MVQRTTEKKEGKRSKPSKAEHRKPLKGEALDAITKVVEKCLGELADAAREHNVEPTAAMQLFSKSLNYFSGNVWDAYQIRHALRRTKKRIGIYISSLSKPHFMTKGCLIGDEVSDSSSDDDASGDEAPSLGSGSDGEDALTDVFADGDVSADDEDDDMVRPTPADPKGKGKAKAVEPSARTRSKLKGREITKWVGRRYQRKSAAASARGKEYFKTWKKSVIEKGYKSVIALGHRVANDKTRLKAAIEMQAALDAYVSDRYLYIHTILIPNSCANSSLPSGS